MPVNALSFFHADSLRQRFADDLDDASAAGRISSEENQWLRGMVDPTTLRSGPQESLRVDRLVIDDESVVEVELGCAWLITQPSSTSQRIYLSTLTHGLESFENREQLLQRLEERYEAIARLKSALEYEKVEGDVFHLRSWTVIDHQIGQLAQVSALLLQLPSLQSALNEGLKQQIETRIPGTLVDPVTGLTQIVEIPAAPVASTQSSVVMGLQTLQDVVLDEFTGQTPGARLDRYFLSSLGQVADAAQTTLYKQAVSDAVKTLSETCEKVLADYWSASILHGDSRRKHVAERLSQVFLLECLAQRHSGLLTGDEFLSLRSLIYPVPAVTGTSVRVRVEKLSVAIGQLEPCKLVGMLLIHFVGDASSDPLMYSPSAGLRRVSLLEPLSAFFKRTVNQDEMLNHSSLNDHALLRSPGALHVRTDEIEHPVFLDQAESVIALQKRNLAFALTQPHQAGSRASVMLDDALDIRRLLDPRLLRVSGGGRWREDAISVDPSGLTAQNSQAPDLSLGSRTFVALPWMEQVGALETYSQQIRRAHLGVECWVKSQLNLYLAVVSEVTLDVGYLKVRLITGIEMPTVDSPKVEVVNLITLVLEWISGFRTRLIPDTSRVLVQSAIDTTSQPVTHLNPAVLNGMLTRLADRFTECGLSDVERFYSQPLRQIDTQLLPGRLACFIRDRLLRLELSLQQRLGELDGHLLSLLKQVLSLPTHALRHSLGDTAADVYGLWITHDPKQPAVVMTNTFIVQRSTAALGKVLLWSSLRGLCEFESVAQMGSKINHWLARPDQRESWLALLNADEQEPVRTWLERTEGSQVSIVIKRIDGHFVQHLQQVEWTRQYRGVEQARQWAHKCRFDAPTFTNLLKDAEQDDGINQALGELSLRIQNALFDQLLPEWLKQASLADMKAFSEILRRYYLTNDPDDDFLADIPNLQDYSRELLRAELEKDFPELNLQPDDIVISFKRYLDSTAAAAFPGALGQTPSLVPVGIVTHTESLTDYAINRSSNVQNVLLSVSTSSNVPLPPSMTPLYLNSVIHRLDVGATFRQRVAQKLDAKAPGYAARLTKFSRQKPAQMLMEALALKLAGELTDDAYLFVESVVEMPDAIARLKLDDREIVLRPIRLVAGQGMAPDNVAGLYLIGPRELTEGPQVLHAILNDDFMFKEYLDQGALLKDIRESESLQSIILERIDPAVRARYADGGFASVHLSWFSQLLPNVAGVLPGAMRPVNLDGTTELGNALQSFFVDTLSVYTSRIKQQTMTSAEVDQSSSRYLLTLGAEQVLSLLPGKLGLAVAAWQSQTLFRQAVAAASQYRWGKAVSEFTAALGILVSAKEQSSEGQENQSPSAQKPLSERAFSWSNQRLTPDLQSRLQQFEVNSVSLSDLQRDKLLNVYRDPQTDLNYASVSGNVYRVADSGEGFRIVGNDETGPRIKLNKDTQQWVLDLNLGLRGGGGIMTTLRTAITNADVDEIFIVEAQGMPDIRLRYIDKARRIGQAHLQAKRYLEVAMDNLTITKPGDSLHPKVTGIIAKFFGVGTPNVILLNKIQRQVRLMFAAIVDPSLSPFSSPRFVVGTNRIGSRENVAFVFKDDPMQHIYFSERFFRPPVYDLKARTPGQAGFNADAHYRAITLIHEVSHLVCSTQDIAYIESSAPYLDLLKEPAKKIVEWQQQRTLSHETRMDALFQTLDANGWRDLNAEDGAATRALLRITGQFNLQGARQVFLTDSVKRSDVILNNADSISLLVSFLGRTEFSVTP